MNTPPVRWIPAVLALVAIVLAGCSPSSRPPTAPSPETGGPKVGEGVLVGMLWVTVTHAEQRSSFEVHGNPPLVPAGVFEVLSVNVKNPNPVAYPWPSGLSKLLAASDPHAQKSAWVKYPASRKASQILDPGPDGVPVLPGGEVNTLLVFDVPKGMTVFGVVLRVTLYAQDRTVLLSHA